MSNYKVLGTKGSGSGMSKHVMIRTAADFSKPTAMSNDNARSSLGPIIYNMDIVPMEAITPMSFYTPHSHPYQSACAHEPIQPAPLSPRHHPQKHSQHTYHPGS